MRMLKCIPNILTSARMVLSLIYLSLLYKLHLYSNNRLYFALAGILFVLICATDFIDGKIARKLKVVSPLGGLLDVAADFIFIVSSLIMLNMQSMIPIWFIFMVIAKFTEFIVTSYIIRKHQNNSNVLFIFDYFGRVAAVNFFLIPGMVLLVYVGLNIIFINIFLYITLILVLISSSARCIHFFKLLNVTKEEESNVSIVFNKSL